MMIINIGLGDNSSVYYQEYWRLKFLALDISRQNRSKIARDRSTKRVVHMTLCTYCRMPAGQLKKVDTDV